MGLAGIGIDLVSISKLRSRIAKNPAFLKYAFTPAEREWCEAYFDPAERYAGRFAAKEAFYKALPSHIQDQTDWLAVEIVPSDNGRPQIRLSPSCQDHLKASNIGEVLLSISHEDGFAAAFVVLCGSI